MNHVMYMVLGNPVFLIFDDFRQICTYGKIEENKKKIPDYQLSGYATPHKRLKKI